jgi:hypothetical protein
VGSNPTPSATERQKEVGEVDRKSIQILQQSLAKGQNPQSTLCRMQSSQEGKTFVPDGRGFAVTKIDSDLNPDHRYYGSPKIASGRYR